MAEKRVLKLNLRQDQSYTYVGYDYIGGDELSCASCENCGRRITNLYDIKGSIDEKVYTVGSECVTTLTTLLNPSEFLEAKRQMTKTIKMIKTIIKSPYAVRYDDEDNEIQFVIYPQKPNDRSIGATYRFTYLTEEDYQKGDFKKYFKGQIISETDRNQMVYDRAVDEIKAMNQYIIPNLPDGIIMPPLDDDGYAIKGSFVDPYAMVKKPNGQIVYFDATGRYSYYGKNSGRGIVWNMHSLLRTMKYSVELGIHKEVSLNDIIG